MTFAVAIHQPNFFPWLGYFDKIVRSDRFVFLDDVQIQKTGGGWANRVKILISGEAKWITAPIDRAYHGVRQIQETGFNERFEWRKSVLSAIKSSYRKAPYYKYSINLIEPLLLNNNSNLAEYNSSAVLAIAEELGIEKSKFQWSSHISHSGQSNELLVSLVKNVGGTSYICGGGAGGYQEESFFDAASIELVRQNFQPPSYSQCGSPTFVPGLSIIDVLMNVGCDGAKDMLFGLKY